MAKSCKTQNVLMLLSDRERHPKSYPYRANKILRNLVQSDNRLYHQIWSTRSPLSIMYKKGHFYCCNYNSCVTLYGHNCKPTFSHSLRPKHAKAKILDAISYSYPVYKPIKPSFSTNENLPLSGYIVCLSKDDWISQHNWENGAWMKEVYVKPHKEKISFLHIDWNTYSEQFILTTGLNPKKKNNNIVAILAVFTVYPLEFLAMFAIKRDIFGHNCKHVNVSDQLMILGMGQHGVHLYSFKDVINEGDLHPCRIGEKYESEGTVGVYPMGLPFNLKIKSAPPLLFDVQCHDQNIDFGGFPLHYIYIKKTNDAQFVVKSFKENKEAINGCIKSSMWLNDNGYAVNFHPDGSNRIIHTTTHEVHCYKIFNNAKTPVLKEVYSMGFPALPSKQLIGYSSYGRKLTRIVTCSELERYVLATDYEDDLELFGVLGISPSDPSSTGFVKLYDNFTGEEVKSVNLRKTLSDTNRYSLHIDLDSIVVIERDINLSCSVYLYQINS